jgi:1-acyl-sn-glycerol-3-phosphate acyltransferase
MDIFVLAATLRYLSRNRRSEPLVGWLCQRTGTLFIERGWQSSSARRTNETITAAIVSGRLVHLS